MVGHMKKLMWFACPRTQIGLHTHPLSPQHSRRMSLPSLPPSLPSSRHIVFSYVTDVGEAAVAAAGETKKVFSCRREREARKDTVVVVVNKDRRTIVGVKILGGAFKERHLLEAPVFFGDLAKYNSTEAPVAWSHTFLRPFPLAEVGRICGIPAGDKRLKNNLSKPGHLHSYVRPTFGGENSKEVLECFENLVMTWIPA